MPTYPSNFNNVSPFNAGPVNNTGLLYQVRNRLLRHNLMPVHRIITTEVGLIDYTPIDWAVGPVKDWIYGITYNSGSQYGLANGDFVVLAGQTDPTQNGLYQFKQGTAGAGYAAKIGGNQAGATGSTGPCFVRLQALFSGAAFPDTNNTVVATSFANAQTFLNSLWNPTYSTWFGTTGSLATIGGSGTQALLDQAGVTYPQGFLALGGATSDQGAAAGSNVNNVIYFTNENQITLGTNGIPFSTVNKFNTNLLPSSRVDRGTGRIGYQTSTLNDFFVNVGVLSELLLNIRDFRESGNDTDMPAAKKAYLANLSQEKIMGISAKMENLMDEAYALYYQMWQLNFMYAGTTGARYPSELNRGYQIWNRGNY
jgi:hypothetical protein